MADPFLGEIMPVGFNYAPVGYALCNGALLNVQQMAALYALLGVIYGGNGTSTFGLPNLQGRMIIGTGITPGTSNNYIQGAYGGNAATAITAGVAAGFISAANVPQLSFNVTPTYTATTTITALAAPTSHVLNPTGNMLSIPQVQGTTTNVLAYAPVGGGTNAAMASGTANTTVTGPVAGSVGSATPSQLQLGVQGQVATLPPYQSVLYIIATQGIWPSRN